MAVWTLKMNIIGKPDVFNFCKTEKLIGFGWGLPDDYVGELKIQDIEKYKAETMNYMVPMAERAIVRYQKYANQIEIMESHILAIFNMIASETTDKKAG